jgi:glucosamine-6-phosphate deaminase
MSIEFDQPAQKIFERMETVVYSDATSASKQIAREIANIIDARNRVGQKTVLGLATGSTPLQVYSEWVRLHKEEGLSFKNVITFNLDEYYPIQPNELQSYVRFMHENLLDYMRK